MISSELREVMRPITFTSKVLWFALTVSIWMYVGVVYFLQMAEEAATRSVDATFAATLSVLSGAMAAASLVYRRWAYSDSRLERTLREEADPKSLAINKQTGDPNVSLRGRLEALRDFELNIFRWNVMSQTSMIVCLALNESIALFGFVIGFLARDVAIVVPFAIVATALNLTVFPRPESIAARAQRWVHLDQS